DRPAGVAEVAPELAEDRRDGERAQRLPALGVVALDGGDEPDAGDLLEVVGRLARVRVAARETAGERPVAGGELFERFAIAIAITRDQFRLRELGHLDELH